MAEGQTATNPKTGERVVLRGGQWVPLGLPTAQPQAGGFRPLTDGALKVEEKTRVLTPEEVRQYPQLDANTLYQISPNGTITVVGGQVRSQLKPLPAHTLDALSNNTTTVKNIEGAMRLFDPANTSKDGVDARDAVGFGTGMLGDWFTQHHDPEGATARARVGQIGGLIIKDTSGAAVSISEDERLKKWVPYVTDSPEVVKMKLANLAREIRLRNETITQTFSEDQGYRPFNLNYGDAPASGQPTGVPPQADQTGGATPTPTPTNNPNDPAGRYPGGIQFNDQAQEQVQSYRFTPDQENAMRTVLMDPNATPDDYAQMVTSFAAKQGVNVDQAYYQSALAEGQRIRAQLAKGGQLGQGVNYKGADETARARAEAEAQRVNAVTGQPGLGDLANQGLTWGLSDEAAGAGKVVGSLLQGDTNIADNYTLGRDAERIRLEQARANTGNTGTAVELGSGLLMGGAGAMANPIKAATVGGALSGYGYGEGAGGSTVSAAGGAALGWGASKFLDRLASRAQTPRAPSQSAQNVANAGKFGIDLPLDAAGGRGARIIGNTLDNMPGSAQAMQAGRDALTEQVTQAVDNVASIAGKATGNEGLGRAVKRGIEGAMARGKDKVSKLYEAISISPDAPATLPNTISKLDELTSKFSSNPDLAKLKISPKLTAYRDALKSGGLSWEDLKALRSDIGDDIGEAIIGEGASRSELRGLYGALTQDMESTAASFGPKALAEFRRANDAARRNFDLQEKVFSTIIGKAQDKSANGVAQTFQGLVKDGKAKADIEHFAKLRGSMTPDEWGEAQSGFVRLMGQPSGSTGRTFSPETFVRTWTDMTPKAKNIMFGSKGPLREALDDFAGTMDLLAQRNALRNTSNTAGQVLTGLGFYSLGNLPGLAAQMGVSFSLAKAFNSPAFVRWATGYNRMLAGAVKAGGQPNVQKQMALLSKVATAEPAIASDILGLQRALSQAFEGAAAQTPMKAAAEDQQPQPPR